MMIADVERCQLTGSSGLAENQGSFKSTLLTGQSEKVKSVDLISWFCRHPPAAGLFFYQCLCSAG
jgi:hypothetical protein